jgi:hypothetical protein
MTLEDFFQQLHDFGTSMNLNVDELYGDTALQYKINQNQNYKPNYVKNGIELDNKDSYIVFLAVYQREENQVRYMNCEQHLRLCQVDEEGLELCKQCILDGIRIRKEDQNQYRLDKINEDF